LNRLKPASVFGATEGDTVGTVSSSTVKPSMAAAIQDDARMGARG